MRVGTKTLKNRLSHFLRKVKAGQTVTVTDRGVPVAELRAITPESGREAEALRALADEGAVTLGKGHAPGFTPVRLKRGARVSDAVLEDRG